MKYTSFLSFLAVSGMFLGVFVLGLYSGGKMFSSDTTNGTLRDVKRLAEEISNTHTYVDEVYDCEEFSRALFEKLKEEGYNPKIVTGCYNSGKYDKNFLNHCNEFDNNKNEVGHVWIEVKAFVPATLTIESVNGTVEKIEIIN